MSKKERIKAGDLTNKGLVKMVDEPWKNKDGEDVDVLVLTHKGPFRMSQLEKIDKPEKPEYNLKDHTDFPTVMGIDIRPGVVKSAERIKKTDKLIHLKVKTNLGSKDVVTNLGSQYEPSDFLGKKFLFVMNMAPVKMAGVKSEAMIMASSHYKLNVDKNEYEEKFILMEVNIPLDGIAL